MPNFFLKKIAWTFVFFIIASIYGYRLWFPAQPYFDETHYVNFIRQLIYNDTYALYSNSHPPLWHLLTALCVETFGDVSLSWRMISFPAHLGVIFMTYLVAKRMTASTSAALVAVFLLTFDCLSLTQARIAMMNSLMLFFILLSVYFFLDIFKKDGNYDRTALRRSGIFWAFALSTKMIAGTLLFFFLPIIAMAWMKQRDRIKPLKDGAVYFVLFPILLLVALHSFIPLLHGQDIADIWHTLTFNLNYHSTTVQHHIYESRWWSWPLMLRPASFFFESQGWGNPGATCQTILAIGNPAVFWMIPVAVLFLLWECVRKKSRVHGIVLLGFLSQWLAFSLIGRFQLFHYFYQVMPFVAIAVAMLVMKIGSFKPWGKFAAGFYLLIVAGMFVYWYPLLVGQTISQSYFYHHMWFRSWI